MSFNAQEIFANLAEKEKIKGHHSPEGQAIRTLSRALHGWSSGNLAGADVIVLCNQAVEDWLKARLNVSPWSTIEITQLLASADAKHLLTPVEADRLQRVASLRSRVGQQTAPVTDIEAALECCIQIVEKRWS